MSPLSKREYFKSIRTRYQEARLKTKSAILDEFCANCGYNRTYAVRKLNKPPLRNPRSLLRQKPGPKSRYNRPEILKPLEQIWLTANLPCSKRLKTILGLWMPSYESTFGALTQEVKKALNQISPATIDRILKVRRVHYRGKGRCTTKPGLMLKSHIPIQTDQWDERRPGFIEADTVAHCGTSVSGTFVYTLDCVDIATGWTEQRAVLGKNHNPVIEQLRDVESSLPFELLGFDCDNGDEFLTHDLLKHFHDRKRKVQFTRSRAYHKDDNAHVEGKNWTHVRQWLGYRRFENPRIVGLLNDLYKSEWRLFHNFLMPSVKLVAKKRVGSKIFKIHDRPKTPYQRVMGSKSVDLSVKERLIGESKNLNPFNLRETIDQKIAAIHKLAK